MWLDSLKPITAVPSSTPKPAKIFSPTLKCGFPHVRVSLVAGSARQISRIRSSALGFLAMSSSILLSGRCPHVLQAGIVQSPTSRARIDRVVGGHFSVVANRVTPRSLPPPVVRSQNSNPVGWPSSRQLLPCVRERVRRDVCPVSHALGSDEHQHQRRPATMYGASAES